MDTIPPELLLNIFSHLFTPTPTPTPTPTSSSSSSEGCTLSLVSRRFRSTTTTSSSSIGSTLSLVSHRFRAIAFLVRFEVIALKSVGRMRGFLEMLERSVNRESTGRPVIRHLFLCDGGCDEGPDYESGGVMPIEVCTKIISLAAPTLVTLAGDLRNIGFTYADLPSDTTFPHLRDFSLGCRNTSADKLKDAEAGFPRMPSLRRLHKFAVFRREEDLLDVNLFTDPEVVPRLTHIRISNFDLLSTIPHIIDASLTRQKSSSLHLPKTLKLLTVQGMLLNEGFEDEDPLQPRLVAALQAMAADKHKGVLCVPEWGDYEGRDCVVDWWEVVRGEGDGCWADPPRETFSLGRYRAMWQIQELEY